MPNKIVVAHINDLITKREVEGATLTRIQAVNHVQVSVRGVLGGREGRNEVLHDGSGQGAECISAVQQERLTLATTRRAVDGYHVTVRLVDRDAVGVDPEPGEAVGRLRGGDNGTLDEVTRVLLGVDAAKDYGSCLVEVAVSDDKIVDSAMRASDLPRALSKPLRSMLKALLLVSPCWARESTTRG